MARRIVLSNSAKATIKDFSHLMVKNSFESVIDDNNFDEHKFRSNIEDFILSEKKILKDCSEETIVNFYLRKIEKDIVDNVFDWNELYLKNLRKQVRSKIANLVIKDKKHNNNIDIYFDEVKAEYIKHPVHEQDSLQFLPENKEIFIKNNLKQAIECAKRYRNMGLEFEDLIQYGNEGLLKAFDKYDTERANLRISIIKDIEKSRKDAYTYDEAVALIKRNFSYSKNLVATIDKVPQEGFDSKEAFISWTKTNIKTAVFASVAFQWIRATIVQALNRHSHVIRVPKSTKTDIDGNPLHKLTIVNLDASNPYTDDIYHDNQISEVTHDEFIKNDENIQKIETENVFNAIVTKLLYKLPNLDRRIIQKRFGIDYPYQLSIHDIAENESISSTTVKESLEKSLKFLNENISAQDKEILCELIR